ncbi:pentapeptide repeat-containing protein [Hoeflea poritis]|uniref:Pentapeptide repeat-containing protein n=1 Tax=Hoeflea poritis TaxID=2993659 RepID=A0ABT4VTV3_9HYPH|nr:pentapeptide repeat-containing protein [Hoeflea poritis]MDA4847477.1 pentapeptide repeat-containing protein [Hoeflea poritis]
MAGDDPRQADYQKLYPKSWALLQLVNESGSQLQNYWIALLSLGSVLVAMIAGITDHDMFLGSPVEVPLLSAQLPLYGFAIAAPLLILFLHAFVLAKYRLLMDALNKLRSLERKRSDKDENESRHPKALEQFMGTSVLLRGLAFREKRRLTAAGITHVITDFSVCLLPLVVLFLIQLKFLRYQSEIINIVHSLTIAADFALCWFFIYWLSAKSYSTVVSCLLVLSSLLFIPTLSWHIHNTGLRPGACTTGTERNSSSLIKRARFFLFSLNPSDNNFVNDREFVRTDDYVAPTLILSRRSYAGANLPYAILRGARLFRANFQGANLLRANLDGASTQRTNLRKACLKEASFVFAQMDHVFLNNAQLNDANLTGADLKQARLYGAKLNGAHLDGVDLKAAKLEDANFENARLIGARLKEVDLSNSPTENATFLGATFEDLTGSKKPNNQLGSPVDFKRLREVLCKAGSYPYVASMIVRGNLLDKSEKGEHSRTAWWILNHRCTPSCPGARELGRHTLAKLWRKANEHPVAHCRKPEFGKHEMPDYYIDCDLFRAYFGLDDKENRKDGKFSINSCIMQETIR